MRLELQGMKNCMEDLNNQQKKINTIITGKHVQVKSYITEESKVVHLRFDIWHAGKNIEKIK